MAAASQDQSLVERRLHRAAQVDPGLRAAGALADVGRAVEAHHHHRLAIAFAQAAGDDADHAGVPVFLGDDDGRRVGIEVAGRLDGGDRLVEDAPFDVLALGVQAVELNRQRARLLRIVGGEQPRAEVRATDAAAGVDPRAKNEAGGEHLGRPLGAGDLHQRGDARVGERRHHLQALRREGAVETDQLGDVADGAKGGQIQPLAQVRLRTVVEQSPGASLAIQRGQQHERHPGGGQHPLPRRAVGSVGVHQGRGGRNVVAHHMVVDHHHAQANIGGGFQRVIGRRAAVNGDHQFNALGVEPTKGRRAGTVAFGHPVGNIDAQFLAHMPEPADQLGGAGGAIDVVVGEHGQRRAGLERVDQQPRGQVHVGEAGGVGEQAF